MGASPYWYAVKHNPNPQVALDALREREFRAGRYNPVIDFPEFPVGPNSPAPGAQHSSIDDAFADADADGTRSILDINSVGDEPDFSVACRLDDAALQQYFGTTRPTRAMADMQDYFEDIERGQCVYFTVYENDQPTELYFAGYSYD